MTQIQHITEKEMTRRTGINPLGYTYPKKDLILLRKGLTGKKKREVLEHETNHLRRGEEGPFDWGSVVGGGLALLGGREQRKGAGEAAAATREQMAKAAGYYKPYREFGGQQLTGLSDWLSQAGYAPADPTMEEIQAGPGYATRLGAVESSAAARGGLLSGNALRRIGEFGASEFESERARRQQAYQQQLTNRLALTGMGERAAGGSAGIAQAGAGPLANIALQRGRGQAGMYGDIAGFAGQYQGRQDWQDFLSRAYPKTSGFGASGWEGTGGI